MYLTLILWIFFFFYFHFWFPDLIIFFSVVQNFFLLFDLIFQRDRLLFVLITMSCFHFFFLYFVLLYFLSNISTRYPHSNISFYSPLSFTLYHTEINLSFLYSFLFVFRASDYYLHFSCLITLFFLLYQSFLLPLFTYFLLFSPSFFFLFYLSRFSKRIFFFINLSMFSYRLFCL